MVALQPIEAAYLMGIAFAFVGMVLAFYNRHPEKRK